jgi:PAS domain S-box-containing protein
MNTQQRLDELRQKAEEQLQQVMDSLDDKSSEDVQTLLHDLHVHQIELTLQNEELLRTQAELEASRKKYAELYEKYLNLYDFAPVGYCTLEKDGTIQEINLSAADQLGIERDLLLKKRIQDCVIEDDQEIIFLHLRKAFETQTRQTCEVRLLKRDGTSFYAQLESIGAQKGNKIPPNPPLGKGGTHPSQEGIAEALTTNHCRTTITDITECKRVEEALWESEKQLKELNASKDSFFSIIAHDLRGPLSSLRALIQSTAENLDSLRPDELEKLVRLERRATENLCNLLENLLTWARIQKGVIEYHPQKIDMQYIVARNMKLLMPNAEHKQITLRSSVRKETWVYGDLHMVEILIRNLISNALKFTKAGGTVVVSATQHEQYVEISVSDTGIGIPEKSLPKLFRIDTKYKRLGTNREPGTGLGLILCKEFVEKLGGRIWVESEEGKGTTFRFTLPKNKGAKKDNASAEADAQP